MKWLTDLPWSKSSKDNLNIKKAGKTLNEDHYGLEKVKERVLEYLAVRSLKKKVTKNDTVRGPILCFTGPPGVGKTSLGKSIAKKGVNPGKGHHHLLIDVDLPTDLSKGIGKDANHVHMGDGSTCKELKLSVGKHVIRTLFANGKHVPFNPAITSTVIVTVK